MPHTSYSDHADLDREDELDDAAVAAAMERDRQTAHEHATDHAAPDNVPLALGGLKALVWARRIIEREIARSETVGGRAALMRYRDGIEHLISSYSERVNPAEQKAWRRSRLAEATGVPACLAHAAYVRAVAAAEASWYDLEHGRAYADDTRRACVEGLKSQLGNGLLTLETDARLLQALAACETREAARLGLEGLRPELRARLGLVLDTSTLLRLVGWGLTTVGSDPNRAAA